MSSLEQIPLFHVRINGRYPPPNGKDVKFYCQGDDGKIYYCKEDEGNRTIRATEWVATKFAEWLGISVARCAVLEEDGETFFGSMSPTRLSQDFELQAYLEKATSNELGKPEPWVGRYFAQVWAFDLFLDNPDRNMRNFILDRDGQTAQIRAFDFADAGFLDFSVEKFPIASSNTGKLGRIIRRRHGAHKAAAFEILDRIRAVPKSVIEDILRGMPESWLSRDRMGGFFEVWSDGRSEQRVSRTKALIEHEWED